MLCLGFRASAQSDSVDVIHYDLKVDIDHRIPNAIVGDATLELKLLRHLDSFALELKQATVDSVFVDGSLCSNCHYASPTLCIPSSSLPVGDTHEVEVFYHGAGYVEGYGWGGFHMDNSIHYNLGVAFSEYPHGFGRSWFPCRDNFHDKATFRISVTTQPGWKSLCGGLLQENTLNEDGSLSSIWLLDHPTPTYLVSVASAPFTIIERDVQGLFGSYPATIGFVNQDSARVFQAYDILEDAVPMFESCFGPYRWDRIGYVGTPKGSMEHVSNIALAKSCMTSLSVDCQSVICHELSHAWFGNLVTCATSGDMWFNEGGASFCEEVAMEAAFGKEYADEYAEQNLESVLRQTHITDDGYKPLYGQTPDYTYGSTVYDKGATVWHSLRSWLGDETFYAAMRTLFENNAFQTINSHDLCDSLSQYAGEDLSPFFDFHVFNPGFVDYHIDSLWTDNQNTHVAIHQTLAGTETPCMENRFDLTFFGANNESYTESVRFFGESTIFTPSAALPFTPVFAAVDLQKRFSNAAICDTLVPTKKGTVELPLVHFKTNVKKVDSVASTLLFVSHHWTRPENADNPGFVRVANRYWTVDGNIPSGSGFNGMFRYSKGGGNGTYSNLDAGFYDKSASLDSLTVLYRKDASHPWAPMKSQKVGNNAEGYLVVNTLKKGEYTLAIVDTSLLAIDSPSLEESRSALVYPNPADRSFRIHIDGCPEPFSIVVRDLSGKMVFQKTNVSNDEPIATDLKNGIFFVEIKDLNNRTLQTSPITFK